MTGRASSIALLIALVAALGLSACGDDDGSDATTATTAPTARDGYGGKGSKQAGAKEAGSAAETIVISGGKPVGGVQELEYDAGEEVRFEVRSDVADEIHVHGYDLSEDVAAGGAVDFSFPADLEGIFEVELEERGEQIAELTVNP